jgi:hypothetical protein
LRRHAELADGLCRWDEVEPLLASARAVVLPTAPPVAYPPSHCHASRLRHAVPRTCAIAAPRRSPMRRTEDSATNRSDAFLPPACRSYRAYRRCRSKHSSREVKPPQRPCPISCTPPSVTRRGIASAGCMRACALRSRSASAPRRRAMRAVVDSLGALYRRRAVHRSDLLADAAVSAAAAAPASAVSCCTCCRWSGAADGAAAAAAATTAACVRIIALQRFVDWARNALHHRSARSRTCGRRLFCAECGGHDLCALAAVALGHRLGMWRRLGRSVLTVGQRGRDDDQLGGHACVA